MAASSPPPRAPGREGYFSWLTDADYFNMPYGYPLHFLATQLRALPQPATDYAGATVVVTGANAGLGREAARHFCRLGAARVVLACRDKARGRAAQADIEATTAAAGVVAVWPLDLACFASVHEFCRRAAAELERVDVVVANAGVATGVFVEADGGFESTVAVNVVGTCLMVLLMLPVLRRTATRWNVEPRLVVVSSDAHMMARFRERHEPQIFEAFKGAHNMNADRYNVSKLLPIWFVRELAARMSARDPVIVNCLTPGFCATSLFRHTPFPLNAIVRLAAALLARTAEMGSRTLLAAAAAGRDSHGQYMDSCAVRDPSRLVRSDEGAVLQRRVYDELLLILDAIAPGAADNVLSQA